MASEDYYEYVWMIEIYSGDIAAYAGSGVSMRNNRVLTCSHLVAEDLPENSRIVGRRVKDDTKYEFEVAHSSMAWDLALIKLKHQTDVKFVYPEISEEEEIDATDELLHFGNGSHVGLFGLATVLQDCIKVCPSTFKTDLAWKKYKIDYSRNEYCVLGNNRDCSNIVIEDVCHRHPMLPTIEFYRSGAAGVGSSGGPLLRKNGKLVGIFILTDPVTHTAVHVSAIKEFLKEADEKESEATTSRNID